MAMPTPIQELPADLAAFLAGDRPSLRDQGANGSATLAPCETGYLVLEDIPTVIYEPDSFGIHEDSLEVDPGPVRAVRVEAYFSEGDYGELRRVRFYWLPDLGRYALWHGTPDSLRLFSKRVTWQEIASRPTWYVSGGAYGVLVRRSRPLQVKPAAGSLQVARTAIRNWKSQGFWHRWFWCLAVAMGLLGGYLMTTSPPPALSPETFDQITAGKSREEVHAIVRAKPGYYDCFLINPSDNLLEEGQKEGIVEWEAWGDSYGILKVGYDQHHRVLYKKVWGQTERPPNHPEQWSWIRRLAQRKVPDSGPVVMWTVF